MGADPTKDDEGNNVVMATTTPPDEKAAALAGGDEEAAAADSSSGDPTEHSQTAYSASHRVGDDALHGEHGNNGWGRGIIKDMKRTLGTYYVAEIRNFDLKTIAVSFFLFFACIAPAITFGAIYEKATNNWIGAVEMILATAWCGIVYALIGGMPMMINGGTGPVLAFSEILFRMSQSMGVPFLTFNAWTGLWVAFYMLVAAVVDLNRILHYATRFTDEIFAFLISTIFIINALGSPFAPVGVFYYFSEDHKSHKSHQDDPNYAYMSSALLSLLICVGTTWLAFEIRRTKFSPFFYHQVIRNAVTDFAVVLSIVAMTLIAKAGLPQVPTETLNVPNTFAPTYACCTTSCTTNWPSDCPELIEPARRRPWVVNLFDLQGKEWLPLFAAVPALLAFILVFLDDGITWHLINHPSHKITHGTAYNYDTVVIGIMVAVNSILGLPWLVAATVRSLNHIHAMAEKTPEGKIVSVKETRLTHLLIHLLCLASIFALDVLKLIPVPVLYGVFLYMGLVSLGTNQFWGRVLMFFMQPTRYPREPYTEYIKPHRRMHYFTLIQLGLFILLYTIKAIKVIAIAFPLIIACCIPVRVWLLPKIFTKEELIFLDSDDATVYAHLAEKEAKQAAKEAAAAAAAAKDEDESQDTTQPDIGSSSSIQSTTAPTTKDDNNNDDDHHEEEEEEHEDTIAPLPNIGGGGGRRARKGGGSGRVKSNSCPAAGSMWGEEEDDAPTQFFVKAYTGDEVLARDRSMHNVVQDDWFLQLETGSGPSMTTTTAAAPAQPPAPLPRPRRRREKTVSCPAHTLFKEADRVVNQNYFFG